MKIELQDPWLVAVWPGMAGVAQIAGSYLVHQLGAEQVADFQPGDYFDLQVIHVKQGLVQDAQAPRNLFYAWKNPDGGRDLLIFLGEKQPTQRSLAFCDELLSFAATFGVKRVLTFAAMATPIHPQGNPRVFAVANETELIDEVRPEVEVLEEGEISGLNGVFLAAASNHELPGICFLGEFPYFASPVPNPKASSAVLKVFSKLSGIGLDLSDLDSQAKVVEQRLVEHLKQLQQAAEAQASSQSNEEQEEWRKGKEEMDAETRARIEAMFERAKEDRTKALDLKAELDRLDVFRKFEDRFLDLFKRAE